MTADPSHLTEDCITLKAEARYTWTACYGTFSTLDIHNDKSLDWSTKFPLREQKSRTITIEQINILGILFGVMDN